MKSKEPAAADGKKIISNNRKAFHDYEILEKLEVGIVLCGSELRPLRAGEVNLKDAWAEEENGELWINDLNINANPFANRLGHDPVRKRKLLANKREILRLRQKMLTPGFTLIPLSMYFKRGKVKVELGLARGKRQYDKRETIAKKDLQREMARDLRGRR